MSQLPRLGLPCILLAKQNCKPQLYSKHLKKHLNCVQLLILSILINLIQEHRWIRLENLAYQFPSLIKEKSRIKKIQRFLSLKQLNIKNLWFPISWCAFPRCLRSTGVAPLHSDERSRRIAFALGTREEDTSELHTRFCLIKLVSFSEGARCFLFPPIPHFPHST